MNRTLTGYGSPAGAASNQYVSPSPWGSTPSSCEQFQDITCTGPSGMAPARRGGRAGARNGALAAAVRSPGAGPTVGAVTGDGTTPDGTEGPCAIDAAAGRREAG
ncbi:hypothetical protein GCM10028783_29960 [Modestobacter muralis]